MKEIQFVDPWEQVQDSVEADGLLQELNLEMTQQHVLWGRKVRTIARRFDCDDVLFEIEGEVPSYAVVHLTWRGACEFDGFFPCTTIYSSLEECLRQYL